MTLKHIILILMNIIFVTAFIMGCGKPPALPESEKEKNYSEILEKSLENLNHDRNLVKITRAIRLFQVEIGRSPTNLSEIVKFHYLDELPEPPEGLIFHYENKTGNIQMGRPRQGAPNPQGRAAPKK